MNAGGGTVTAAAGTGPAALLRRSDAGTVRLSDRDIAELLLAGEIYGAPYDLLAAFLEVRPDRACGIVARWRHAGVRGDGPARARAGVVLADPAGTGVPATTTPHPPRPQPPDSPAIHPWRKPLCSAQSTTRS